MFQFKATLLHCALLIYFMTMLLNRTQWNNGLSLDLWGHNQPFFLCDSMQIHVPKHFLQKDVVSSGCSEILQLFSLTGICLLYLFFTQAAYIMHMIIERDGLLNLLVNQVTSIEWGLDYKCTDNANSSTMPYMLCWQIWNSKCILMNIKLSIAVFFVTVK